MKMEAEPVVMNENLLVPAHMLPHQLHFQVSSKIFSVVQNELCQDEGSSLCDHW